MKTWREKRRVRAVELAQANWEQKTIAEALGVHRTSVYRWTRAAEEGGIEALADKKPPGRPPDLTPEEFEELGRLLEQGAVAHGFEGDRWIAARVADVIFRQFGVAYSHGHTCKILAKLGWTVQKPTRRSTRRDDQAVATWRKEHWPEVKKRPLQKIEKSSS